MKYILLVGLCLSLLAACSCQSKTGPQSQPLFPDDITGHAWATHAAFMRAVSAGTEKSSSEIPAAYWAEGIRALNPLKVYIHRVNIVVVQRIGDGTEEGKYIYIPISSYLPHTGEDGFVFGPNPSNGDIYALGKGVFDFKRTTSK